MSAVHLQDGPLQTTLRDLALSVEWFDLREVKLSGTEWTVVLGHKRREDPLRAVLPLPLHTTSLKPSDLKAIFKALSTLSPKDVPAVMQPLAPSIRDLQDQLGRKTHTGDSAETTTQNTTETDQAAEEGVVNDQIDPETIYMAIVTMDSTVVYYRLSRGIKKPADIPDE